MKTTLLARRLHHSRNATSLWLLRRFQMRVWESLLPFHSDGDMCWTAMSFYRSRLDSTIWTNPFEDFAWDASAVGMMLETSKGIEGIEGQCPGLDALLNCHFGLFNIKRGDLEYNDDIGASRATSYMAGSMTPYHDAKSIVSQNVVAGGELFKSYGEKWFQDRTTSVGLIPFPQDYQKAERLLRKLKSLELKYNLTMTARLDLFDMMTTIRFESRTMNALPRHYMHVDIILNTSIRSWYQQNSTRTTQN